MTDEEKKLKNPVIYQEQREAREGTEEKRINPVIYRSNEGKILKHPEEKMYLLLYLGTDKDGTDVKSFEYLIGRTATRKFIIDMVEFIDIHESKVCVEGEPIENSPSVYNLLKYFEQFYEDGFDIEDHNDGDYDHPTE